MKTELLRQYETSGDRDPEARGSRLVASAGAFIKVDFRKPRIIAVTSGKGGVGKTNVVANLAVSLSELGKKVVILDADFGLANMDVLLGLTPRYHLGHVLYGNKQLSEIMIQGPKGVRIIPASSGLQQMSELTSSQRHHLAECFTKLDADAEYLIMDTAAGISRNVVHFLLSAHEVVVVSVPEPTAIVDAYALIKVILAEEPGKQIQVLINSAENAAEAHEVYSQINSVVKRFLNREIEFLGHVRRDSHVSQAVRSQMLVTQKYPNASSSRCFRDIARRIRQQERGDATRDGIAWEEMLNDWIN
jgi:flagellar biosynthesis protein FlhG